MEKKILTLDAKDLSIRLHQGNAVIFPTDTLPALGVCPKYSNKLWKIKNRPKEKPLILMASKIEQLFKWVLPIALEDASKMAERYWPGALTLVLPAIGKEVELLNQKNNSIGMRVPRSSLARELLSHSGPLATTSANLSGGPPSLSAEEAFRIFPKMNFLGPMPWPDFSGLASTVISWESEGNWRLLRRGAVIPKNLL